MSVQWLTRDAGTPTVRYGLSPVTLSSTQTGNTTTYSREDMCGAAANSYGWIDPGTMNNVILTDLEPGTVYYYAYGDPVSLYLCLVMPYKTTVVVAANLLHMHTCLLCAAQSFVLQGLGLPCCRTSSACQFMTLLFECRGQSPSTPPHPPSCTACM